MGNRKITEVKELACRFNGTLDPHPCVFWGKRFGTLVSAVVLLDLWLRRFFGLSLWPEIGIHSPSMRDIRRK